MLNAVVFLLEMYWCIRFEHVNYLKDLIFCCHRDIRTDMFCYEGIQFKA